MGGGGGSSSGGAGGPTAWGGITGTLSDQADLQAALDAKISNATHTGDATGDTVLTIQPGAITGKAAVTADGADYVLISDTSDGGALKKALVSSLGGGGLSAAGSAILNFGTGAGSNTTETTVLTAIPAGASMRAWFQSEGNSDHNEIEHRLIFPSRIGLTCGSIAAGVSFKVYAETELRLTGNVTCRWEWRE